MRDSPNIVVPLAGKDKAFEARGMIKPLTKVAGKEIIRWIAESRPFPYDAAIFVVLQEHQAEYGIVDALRSFFGENIRVVIAEQMTEGSPQSILLARELIDNDEELLIDLGDQYLDLAGFADFLAAQRDSCAGVIPTFESYYYNRGYMLLDDAGRVLKVSEKDATPISTHSTACISYFRHGTEFVRYADRMIARQRTAANGAYLPSLVYNELIEAGKTVLSCPCELVAPLGTVEGADCFPQINRPLRGEVGSRKSEVGS